MQNMHESLSRISFEELASFVAVVDANGFSNAAKVMGRDPTILSRRVTQLENRLGVRLLSRTTRSVVLTEVGTTYYARVRALLDELDTASLEASNLASSPQGLLRVSLPSTFGRLWVSPLLPSFIEKHPKIKIDARFSDRVVDLVAENFDVAIRVGSLRNSTMKAKKIASFKYILVASPAFIAKHGLPNTPDDLSKFSCLGFTNFSFWPEWKLMKDGKYKTVRPESPFITDNSEAMLSAAIDGIGIALAADWLAGAAIRDGKLVEILCGWEAEIGGGIFAVMPPGRLVPNKTRLFVDEITESIRSGWYKP